MSNRIFLQTTEFIDIPQGTKTYGWRMYDDYCQFYSNIWESIPCDNLELLATVIQKGDDQINDLLDFIKKNNTGIDISGTWYVVRLGRN